MYRLALYDGDLDVSVEDVRREIPQYDYVACWCKEESPCHVDVLLEVASES